MEILNLNNITQEYKRLKTRTYFNIRAKFFKKLHMHCYYLSTLKFEVAFYVSLFHSLSPNITSFTFK